MELGHQRPFAAQLHGREVATTSLRPSDSERPSTRQILKTTLEMEGLISKHSAIMDKYDPQKKVALVVDEWGGWYAPLPGSNPGFLVQQNSLRDAVLAALNLNIFARHADRVRMANIAQMINVLQAMIMTDKEKMVLTPTYYVFKMYVPFQDATFVPVTFNAGTYTHGDITLPRVDAIAAKDTSGKTMAGDHESRSQSGSGDRGQPDRHHSEISQGRNPDRAQGGQRQHLRCAEHRGTEAGHRQGRRRQTDSEA